MIPVEIRHWNCEQPPAVSITTALIAGALVVAIALTTVLLLLQVR